MSSNHYESSGAVIYVLLKCLVQSNIPFINTGLRTVILVHNFLSTLLLFGRIILSVLSPVNRIRIFVNGSQQLSAPTAINLLIVAGCQQMKAVGKSLLGPRYAVFVFNKMRYSDGQSEALHPG